MAISPKNLTIPVLLGTGRKGRKSEAIARYVHERAVAYGFDSPFYDVRDFLTDHTFPPEEDNAIGTRWKEIVLGLDGLIIVSPEYNHGYPGELKMLLDKAYKEYHRRAVALCGVSNGWLGGARMVEQMIEVFNTLQLVCVQKNVCFSNCDDLVTEKNEVTAGTRKQFDARLEGLFTDLAWYAQVLRDGRENYPRK
jgi:NAD(P)H-dependent FMN reductase